MKIDLAKERGYPTGGSDKYFKLKEFSLKNTFLLECINYILENGNDSFNAFCLNHEGVTFHNEFKKNNYEPT